MDTTGRYYEDTATLNETSDGAATTVAAVFVDRERAHDAVHRLHDEGFTDTWIGITRADDGYSGESPAAMAAGDTRVESENWFTRFFGEGDESLHDALIRHGVREADARTAAGTTLPAHSAILTVDGSNHPELAAQVITECSGQIITRGFGATGYGTSGMFGATGAQAPTSRTSSLIEDGIAPSAELDDRPVAGNGAYDVAVDAAPSATVPDASAYDDYGRYRAGTPVDESTRLQLREERLRIDKSRISRGEATIGTEIVSEKHDIDVPLVREELFIERRPVSGSVAVDGAAFENDREVIRVPLSEERVTISKTPVVTEEVVIGKRQVEETQHVSETTRKEQLDVKDVDSSVGVGGARDPRY